MMVDADTQCLILASGSRIRRELLQAAGLAFTVVPADIDEPVLRRKLTAQEPALKPHGVALALARAKAEEVSRNNPTELVIGCDQVLDFKGEIIAKPANSDAARAVLDRLRGEQHQLHSAVALAEDGNSTWSTADTASLKMRAFSLEFLDEYIARGGASLCQSAGAYQIESIGIQLFEHIVGDHYSILGLPLMSLLAELRARKVIAG